MTRFCPAIALASANPSCNWKSVSSGLAGSNFGKPSGGLAGICLAIGGRSVRGAGRRIRRAALVLQHMVEVGLTLRPEARTSPPVIPATATSGLMPSPWIERPDGV